MVLREIDTSDARYPFVEGLLHSAFPVAERRDDDAQRYNTDHESSFHCCVVESGSDPVGLLTYWTFDGFSYIEHFAVDPSMRNKGYGEHALLAFLSQTDVPVVLEVEMPDTDLSRRRIGFYQRQGLRLWDSRAYLQPPYRQGDAYLPMHIMATPGLNPDKDFEHIRNTIYTKVYRTSVDN